MTGIVIPKFYITHVVYSVPGKSSSMKYSVGTTLGSATSTTSSYSDTAEVTVKGGWKVLGLDGRISASASMTAEETDVSECSVATIRAQAKPGVSDLIDHDNDEIWFIMHPRLSVTATPAGAGQPPRVAWQFAEDQSQAQLFSAYVGELKDPSLMPERKMEVLREHHITEADFPGFSKPIPFPTGPLTSTRIGSLTSAVTNLRPRFVPIISRRLFSMSSLARRQGRRA